MTTGQKFHAHKFGFLRGEEVKNYPETIQMDITSVREEDLQPTYYNSPNRGPTKKGGFQKPKLATYAQKPATTTTKQT